MSTIQNNINTYADLNTYNNADKDYPNISYIQGTDEVKWVKEDPYIIVCKYNVTSTESATKLLNSNTGITYQIIDGVQQQSIQTTYTFDTLGEHIVKYKLSGTSIDYNAFNGCSDLTSISIPDSVTSIGNSAFYMSGLTSVTIPDSVTSIGNTAFYQCTGLTSVTIGNGVTKINMSTFQYCSGLTTVTIGSGVTKIDTSAFRGCSSLTSIDIPNSVTTIGMTVFQSCTGLRSVTIGSGVTKIDINAFAFCQSLTSITVNATTPPTIDSTTFNNTNNCPIYVPAESVSAYKTATNWSSLASRIQAI